MHHTPHMHRMLYIKPCIMHRMRHIMHRRLSIVRGLWVNTDGITAMATNMEMHMSLAWMP